MPRQRKLPDLVAAAEVATILGVSKARVHQLADTPAFPAPLYRLSVGLLWERSDIETFAATERKPGRPRKGEST